MPTIDALSPTHVENGHGKLDLTVTGKDFVVTSIVQVNGNDRSTRFVSPEIVIATLPATDFDNEWMLNVAVMNPKPGGGTSNVLQLDVTLHLNPVPTLSGFLPAFAAAGSGAVEVTVTGTGFMPGSTLMIDETPHAMLYVSATKLKFSLSAPELAKSRTYSVRVDNPWPGGGPSAPRDFEVRAPVPAITSFGSAQTLAGQSSYVLRVNGTSFFPNSVVSVNGSPRATRFISAQALEVTLVADDLTSAGLLAIAVTNPAPGGGTSAAVTFAIVNPVPEITLLPSRGASAGLSGFTLYVHGRGFTPASVVRWNGADRPTQFISATRTSATISASDVAIAGVVSIVVSNPAPGGGISPAATMTVRIVGAVSATDAQMTLKGRDLLFEPASARIYVSIAGDAPANGNNVIAVDPVLASITGSTFVGSEPSKMAISGDGRALYVGLNGADAVRRVELPALSPTLQWSLGAGNSAGDLVVLPGSQTTVAVTRHNLAYIPALMGVAIYDNGVARPTTSASHTGANRLEALESATVLYGFNNAHSGFGFYTLAIDASGVRHVSETSGLINGFTTDLVGAAGRIYATDGSIIDAERLVKIGSFGTADIMAVDPELGRAFLLTGGQLTVYDLNTFQLLGTVTVPTPVYDPPPLGREATVSRRLVRWGADGIAYLDKTRLIMVRSPIIGP